MNTFICIIFLLSLSIKRIISNYPITLNYTKNDKVTIELSGSGRCNIDDRIFTDSMTVEIENDDFVGNSCAMKFKESLSRNQIIFYFENSFGRGEKVEMKSATHWEQINAYNGKDAVYRFWGDTHVYYTNSAHKPHLEMTVFWATANICVGEGRCYRCNTKNFANGHYGSAFVYVGFEYGPPSEFIKRHCSGHDANLPPLSAGYIILITLACMIVAALLITGIFVLSKKRKAKKQIKSVEASPYFPTIHLPMSSENRSQSREGNSTSMEKSVNQLGFGKVSKEIKPIDNTTDSDNTYSYV